MTTMVFLLEEPSAQAMLESFLPRILPEGYEAKFVVFEGKSDLEKRLVLRLREWQKPDCQFIILRDQDSAVCKDVKAFLRQKCNEGQHPETLIRIACHELESWYLGDLLAVEAGLEITGLARLQNKAKYRNPDLIANSAEELKKITKCRYQKISGSREIGKHLEVDRNLSHSFTVFTEGLFRLWGDSHETTI
ncbi:MAG: DUF4276 family protein [Clostridia bacterium]